MADEQKRDEHMSRLRNEDYLIEPRLYQIYGGRWAAAGIGWAVHADTREQAIEKYWQAVEKHKEVDARPYRR